VKIFKAQNLIATLPVPVPPPVASVEPQVLKSAQGRVARGLLSETENTMSNSISTLLLRNLSDVFGENDPVRRRAAIDELFNEDAVFYDPKSGIFRGRDEIDRIAGVIKATHPDFKYQPLFPPEEMGDAGRVRWVSGTPGKPPAYAGTDFIVARNGRIASLYLFFDNLP
jgi:SnoaL-like domain